MASPMLPLIFSLPIMKAVVGLSLPANIFTKSSPVNVNVLSASPAGAEPFPADPPSFFKSRYHSSPSGKEAN